jgi:uncharacterized protein (TIGR03435 family)
MGRRLWLAGGVWITALALGCATSAAENLKGVVQPSAETLAATYDVVTIKPNRNGGRPDSDTNEDSFVAKNFTLRALLGEAYGIRGDLISKVPGPVGTVRFNVEAKIVDPEAIERAKKVDRGAMLRQVLFERFHLEAHVVKRVLPVYEMVVMREGPKFKETPPADAHGEDMDVWRRRIQAKDTSMRSLASALSDMADHYVLDKTGLTGAYDFTLRWTTDVEQSSDVEMPPGLFAAIEDELGLRLRRAKAPVDTLVVDYAEMPSEN